MNFAIACGIVHPNLSLADVDSIIDSIGLDDEGLDLPDFTESDLDDDMDSLCEDPIGPADHINDLYA